MFMEQFKRAQVIMLPTVNNPTSISIANKSKIGEFHQFLFGKKRGIYNNHTFQHLYIISDEKIKESDWYIVSDYTKSEDIRQATQDISRTIQRMGGYKKIIATTDTSLKIKHEHSPYLRDWDLPQPSQQFIEKYIEEYNKGNIITDVLVEYKGKALYTEQQYFKGYKDILKINPKDNTITIKKLKDSWNREDLHSIAIEFFTRGLEQGRGNMEDKNDCNSYRINIWIDQNL